MTTPRYETEVKFYVRDLKVIQARLHSMGAQLFLPRTLEVNLRFDLQDGSLRRAARLLRLRQSDAARLTYKGPSEEVNGALVRPELEITINDFESARQLLEALGFVVINRYEKYRSGYQLGEAIIMLDELPYGHFVEIEAKDVENLRNMATRLGLDWQAAIPASYLALFERLCALRGLDPAELTFAALNDIHATPGDLSIRPADE